MSLLLRCVVPEILNENLSRCDRHFLGLFRYDFQVDFSAYFFLSCQ